MIARADGRLGPKLRRSDVDCSDPGAPAAKNDDGTSKCGFRRLPGKATGRATMTDTATPLLNGAVDAQRPVEDRTVAADHRLRPNIQARTRARLEITASWNVYNGGNVADILEVSTCERSRLRLWLWLWECPLPERRRLKSRL